MEGSSVEVTPSPVDGRSMAAVWEVLMMEGDSVEVIPSPVEGRPMAAAWEAD